MSRPNKKIRVLIAEDSKVISTLLKAILDESNEIEVIAIARDGNEAIEMVKRYRPDLITMDIFMPHCDGFLATKTIMAENPVPIIVISSKVNVKEMAVTFNSLAAGALAVIEKVSLSNDDRFLKFKRDLLHAIRVYSDVPVIKRRQFSKPANQGLTVNLEQKKIKLLAFGASTGGPEAINCILSRLSKDISFPILIVQHITAGFIQGFIDWLQLKSPYPVKLLNHNETLKAGVIYFAPDNYQLKLRYATSHIVASLEDETPINGFKPSIDYLFTHIDVRLVPKMAAGILTGMGTDGANGLKQLKDAGAITFAQDEQSSVVFGMPLAAAKLNAAAHTLSLQQIPDFIAKLNNTGGVKHD